LRDGTIRAVLKEVYIAAGSLKQAK
jgi:hypothetical protein